MLLPFSPDALLLPAKIRPPGIERLNQRDLLASAPALELLLARNRISNSVVRLKVNQPIEMISLRKTRMGALLMLASPVVEVIGDPDV